MSAPNHVEHCANVGSWRLLGLGGLFLVLHAAITSPAGFAGQLSSEYQVKAAYISNLLKFVEWPEDSATSSHGKWLIGVIGDTPVAYELSRLVAGKSVQGRGLEVKTIQSVADVRECNLLFISASERKRLPSILAALRGSTVLTVADMDNFIESGGMVQFVVERNRVRMTIDVGAASSARLKISAKLLALAGEVTARNTE